MNITILTVGTRGDVQPFVALGKELVDRGYHVTICTGKNFKRFVEDNGLIFSPVTIDYLELTQSEEGKKMMGGNPIEIVKNMKTMIIPMMERMLDDLWASSRDADLIIYHPKAFGGYDIAEKLGVPVFVAHPIPAIAPTRLFSNPALPVSFNFGWVNEISFKANRLFMASFFKLINNWRRETLGLNKKRNLFTNDLTLHNKPIPVLYGCSPEIIPFDPNWNGSVSMSGFWFLEDKIDWEPPTDLLHFLEIGPPPIAISFSSMPLKNPYKIKAMLEEALEIIGQRGLFITGWSGMDTKKTKAHIHSVQSIPHSWLFKRTSGVVHHGGAGTTAAVLKAGKPMIICPFSGDQPFWAKRMHDLHLSTAPLREKDMTVEAFVTRIQELVNNQELTSNAIALSERIAQEEGIKDTVDFIEECIR
ncbi:glycosyltransferase [Bacillus suaedae]|uniref:Glycosyltransferase family 1 protein n=1 Tax=Halalkalibacter suaedae TaxID=2822140 RepID=A0A940WS05_9BACI|nr:glycosyltransferase [Bacillus suaedae]MBP3951634.1 glycosyltransferase family 1 protein [Bacillus suaedae]